MNCGKGMLFFGVCLARVFGSLLALYLLLFCLSVAFLSIFPVCVLSHPSLHY